MSDEQDLIHPERLGDADGRREYQPHIASPEDHDKLFRHIMHEDVESVGPCEEKLGLGHGSLDCASANKRKAALAVVMAHYNHVKNHLH